MDYLASILIDCALFTAKLYVSCYLYKLYKMNAECLKSLKESGRFEINSELRKEVERNGGVIKCAAISGRVKALCPPIQSQPKTFLNSSTFFPAVIQEKVTQEHKIKWMKFLGTWKSVDNPQRRINFIPFALANTTSGLFEKQTCVEVIKPLAATELFNSLSIVHDNFLLYRGNAAVGHFRGEMTKGIQEVERVLCEGATITAVGKLIIENNNLKIKQPDNGLKYILSNLTFESLYDIFYYRAKYSMIGFTVMGTVTLCYFIYASSRVLLKIKKRRIEDQRRKQMEEQRELRMALELHGVHRPKCVICLENCVEVLVLICGHVCMCYDCSVRIKRCPICNNPVARKVPAFYS